MITACCFAAAAVSSQAMASTTPAPKKGAESQERPNIVWYLTEDLSPQMYALFMDGKGCEAPNAERLAREGVIYTNAYSNAAVSSAARTTLITGCFAPSFEGSFHRKVVTNPMPENLNMFPYYLRQAGYYTLNAQKTDYNVELDTEAWDVINAPTYSWADRPDKSQPFFLMRTNAVTHESSLHFNHNDFNNKPTEHDPAKVDLLPMHPDTKLMRYTYATLYDRIMDSDRELGEIVDRLEQEGELDNTIILFFGDNGGCLPGTKGYTDDIGVHVPLVVYVPQKWRDKLGIEAGSTREDLVSFMDFGATTLNLAGAEIPERMDGIPFLGEDSERGRESVVCYGDRFDEYYSFNRSIRKGDLRYERSFNPYQRQSLFASYRVKQIAFQEWYDLYNAGGLNEAQSRFFQEYGVEELYDLKNDPFELNNLASDPKYKKELKELRGDLYDYLIDRCDLGFFPENIIHEEAMENPDKYGDENKARIKRFVAIADLQRSSFSKAKKSLEKYLASSDNVEQWWALATCISFGEEARSMVEPVKKLLKSDRGFVRQRAMLFLGMMGETFTKSDVMSNLEICKVGTEAMVIFNDVAIMVEEGYMKAFPIDISEVPVSCVGVERRTNYIDGLYNKKSILEIVGENKPKAPKKKK